uniref:Uncharacterized protein n=1 Tax=Aegilops tauschii subsp. strangulata TaxID=200361 RepID=A0A453RIT7_AEGTS
LLFSPNLQAVRRPYKPNDAKREAQAYKTRKHQASKPYNHLALAQRRAAVTAAPNPVLCRVAPLPLAAMGSCLSTQPGDEPAWPLRWRKRPHGEREGAAAGGAFFSGGGGGGGGKKLPGEGEMTEEELARVAGRTCANGASAAACLHTQQGRKGTNQDAMVVWEVSCQRLATAIFFLQLGGLFRWIWSPDRRRRWVHGRFLVQTAAFLSQLLAFTLGSLPSALRVNHLVCAWITGRFGFQCCLNQGETRLRPAECLIRNERDFTSEQ